MPVIEQYFSPDQTLRLVVDLTDGDWTVGFDGFGWHVHGNILDAWGYAGTSAERVRAFVHDIVSSRREICVYRIGGITRDITVPDDYVDRPLRVDRYAPDNETVEVRFWDSPEIA